jgi:hypothetical protein
MVFSAQSVPKDAHETIEYVMLLLSNNFTAKRNGVFGAVLAGAIQ